MIPSSACQPWQPDRRPTPPRTPLLHHAAGHDPGLRSAAAPGDAAPAVRGVSAGAACRGSRADRAPPPSRTRRARLSRRLYGGDRPAARDPPGGAAALRTALRDAAGATGSSGLRAVPGGVFGRARRHAYRLAVLAGARAQPDAVGPLRAAPGPADATAPANSPSRSRLWCATAGPRIGEAAPSAGATPSPNCSPCKPNMPHGPTVCPTACATASLPKLSRPSSTSISRISPRSSRPVVTAVPAPKRSGEFSSGAFGENSTGIDRPSSSRSEGRR